jgi:hypothetical protein
MNTAELQFNIIYTPGTARHLCMFVPSLLEWMDSSFRLVSNGCSPEEIKAMRELCASDDRLEFVVMSEEGMIHHGEAINWLYEHRDRDAKWFCYMDSDIIATGPLAEEISVHLDKCDVFSTGLPLWHAPEDTTLPRSFRRMQGTHIWTGDGDCIACDYIAIFNNELLTRMMEETGIGFQYYHWDGIPAETQQVLRDMHMDKIDYDTGKVITPLLIHEGARVVYEDLKNLRHLGGFSGSSSQGASHGYGVPMTIAEDVAFIYRGRLDHFAVGFLGGFLARPLLYLADIWYGLRRMPPGLTPAEHETMPFAEKRISESRLRKRLNTGRYFNVMMRAVLEGTEPPGYPLLGHRPAELRLVAAAECIREIIAKHHPDKQ